MAVPFLRSPKDPTRCKLVWLDADRRKGSSCLRRIEDLNGEPEIPDGIIKLTREDIHNSPPDFLFISLEMLQKEICNPRSAKTFGAFENEKPRLILFDEIHNYSGLNGSHTPWIVSRLKNQIFWDKPKNLHVVGLSATLKDAKKHLSLVGCVKEDRVVEFSLLRLNYTMKEENIILP